MLKRLNSNTPEARIINEIIAKLEALEIKAGPGIRLISGPHGTAISADPAKGGGEPPASDWYQGDWRSDRSYDTGHGVSIRGGLTAGLYLAIDDVPAGLAAPSPADVTRWVRVATDNPMGFWI